MLPSTFSSSNHVTGSRERVHSSDCALCPPWVPLGQLFPLSPNVSPIVEAQEESQEAEDVEEDCSVEAIREWALCEEVVARMSSNGHKLALEEVGKRSSQIREPARDTPQLLRPLRLSQLSQHPSSVLNSEDPLLASPDISGNLPFKLSSVFPPGKMPIKSGGLTNPASPALGPFLCHSAVTERTEYGNWKWEIPLPQW